MLPVLLPGPLSAGAGPRAGVVPGQRVAATGAGGRGGVEGDRGVAGSDDEGWPHRGRGWSHRGGRSRGHGRLEDAGVVAGGWWNYGFRVRWDGVAELVRVVAATWWAS